MKLDWLGDDRELVGALYRAANAYSQVCKNELLGETVHFSPYEVQIMEYIMEFGDENKNMAFYAQKMGLSPSTYSKYIRRLTNKGLLDRYQTLNNRKNIILKVSPLGMEEYNKYVKAVCAAGFGPFLQQLQSYSPEARKTAREIINLWSSMNSSITDSFHTESDNEAEPQLVKLATASR